MPDASFVVTSFQGGEWSPFMQGNIDNPKYRTAMNLCLNAYPIEEGACVRRTGTRFAAPTRSGADAKLLPFDLAPNAPYKMEFTNGHLRLFNGTNLVVDQDIRTITNISSENPAVVTVGGALPWQNGDQVVLLFQSAEHIEDAAALRNRQFVITLFGGSSFTIADPVTGAVVDGTTLGWTPDLGITAARILDISTPYSEINWSTSQLRAVQAQQGTETLSVLLHPSVRPQVVMGDQSTGVGQFANFSLSQTDFLDGPYLDPVPGSQLTPSGLSGSIQVTISYQTWASGTVYAAGNLVTFSGADYKSLIAGNVGNTPNTSPTDWQVVNSGSAVGPNGFLSTDVGRLIRIFSQPLPWAVATNYTTGQAVTFNDNFYIAIAASTAAQPDTHPTDWAITPTAATWSWGQITSIVSANSANVLIRGPALLYTTLVTLWQIGAYSNTTGWPTCGTYHQGRLWLSGAIPNRFDASNSNDLFNFASTGPDGTVADSNAIAGTFNATDLNTIFWMQPMSLGIVCGTQGGEWLIQASALNDPLTPSSIQAHRVTKYGCADIEPRMTGLAIVFVQKYGRKCMEFLADVFSGKFSAPNMSKTAKHLTQSGILEIAYQEELAPIIWARTGSGQLIGATYRRTSAFSTEEPTFVGWHQHELGSGRQVQSLCVTATVDGTLDELGLVTVNTATGVRHVELMTPLFDEDTPLTNAWFVDDAVTPSGALTSSTGVTFFGLWHLNGNTVSAVVGGLDCGDHPVSGGSMFVPFLSDPGQLFTKAFMDQLSASGVSFGDLSTFLDTIITVTPARASTPETVLGYVGPLTQLNGDSPTGAFYDAPNNQFLVLSTDNTNNTGLRVFSAQTGAPLLGLPNPGGVSMSGTALFKDAAGFLYVYGAPSNSNSLYKLNPGTFTIAQQFGKNQTAGESNSIHTGYNMLSSVQTMVPVFAGGNYAVCSSTINAESAVINLDTMTYAGSQGVPVLNGGNIATSGGQVNVCPGLSGAAVGTAFGLSCLGLSTAGTPLLLFETTILGEAIPATPTTPAIPAASAFPAFTEWSSTVSYPVGALVVGTSGFGFFQSLVSNNLNNVPSSSPTQWATLADPGTNPGITVELRRSFAPSDIDPSLVSVGSFTGPVMDQFDGNIIFFVGSFALKVRANDGAILWKSTVPSGVPHRFELSSVNGTFSWMNTSGTGGTCTILNTISGAMQSFSVVTPTGMSQGGTIWNSNAGVLLSFGSFSATTGGPQPILNTPSSFSGRWFQFQLGTLFFPFTSSRQRDTIPAVIGYTYTTQGQVVRPQEPQQTGAANGPALGKTRRNHMFAALIHGSVTGVCSFGTDFSAIMRPAIYKTPGGKQFTTAQLFAGILQGTIESDYNFDGMLCWQISRPLPTTIVSLGGFLNTQDR